VIVRDYNATHLYTLSIYATHETSMRGIDVDPDTIFTVAGYHTDCLNVYRLLAHTMENNENFITVLAHPGIPQALEKYL
jgi:hypothetical protein